MTSVELRKRKFDVIQDIDLQEQKCSSVAKYPPSKSWDGIEVTRGGHIEVALMETSSINGPDPAVPLESGRGR